MTRFPLSPRISNASIAATAVGSFIFILILASLIIFFIRRRRKRQNPHIRSKSKAKYSMGQLFSPSARPISGSTGAEGAWPGNSFAAPTPTPFRYTDDMEMSTSNNPDPFAKNPHSHSGHSPNPSTGSLSSTITDSSSNPLVLGTNGDDIPMRSMSSGPYARRSQSQHDPQSTIEGLGSTSVYQQGGASIRTDANPRYTHHRDSSGSSTSTIGADPLASRSNRGGSGGGSAGGVPTARSGYPRSNSNSSIFAPAPTQSPRHELYPDGDTDVDGAFVLGMEEDIGGGDGRAHVLPPTYEDTGDPWMRYDTSTPTPAAMARQREGNREPPGTWGWESDRKG